MKEHPYMENLLRDPPGKDGESLEERDVRDAQHLQNSIRALFFTIGVFWGFAVAFIFWVTVISVTS